MVPIIYEILRRYCTLGAAEGDREENRDRFDRSLAAFLESCALRRREACEVWAMAWDKPFFANAPARVVTPYIESAREAGLFDDPAWVASDEFIGPTREPGPRLRHEINTERLAGQCKALPRLLRVQSLARALNDLTAQVNAFAERVECEEMPLPESQEYAIQIAEGIAAGADRMQKVDGFGFTTACHLLADLGLPLYKPDIWICRIVSLLPHVSEEIQRAWQLNALPASLDWLYSRMVGARGSDAYRRIVQPAMNALLDNAGDFAPDGLDLSGRHKRVRLVDWTVVHFAISPEKSFGLDARPVDLLRSDCPVPAPEHVRAFAKLIHARVMLQELENEFAKLQKNASKPRLPTAKIRRRKSEQRRQTLGGQLTATRQAVAMAEEAFRQTVADTEWHLAPHFLDGLARHGATNRWQYIRRAREKRDQANGRSIPPATPRGHDSLLP